MCDEAEEGPQTNPDDRFLDLNMEHIRQQCGEEKSYI